MQKNEQIFEIASENDLKKIIFPLKEWDRIFFFWDLWAGKTTFIRALLRHHFSDEKLIIRSPTYTYYQEYRWSDNIVHHFDLYRLEDEETFYLIGGTEIANHDKSIMLIEWPEIIENQIAPTKIIHISYDEKTNKRIIKIQTL